MVVRGPRPTPRCRVARHNQATVERAAAMLTQRWGSPEETGQGSGLSERSVASHRRQLRILGGAVESSQREPGGCSMRAVELPLLEGEPIPPTVDFAIQVSEVVIASLAPSMLISATVIE